LATELAARYLSLDERTFALVVEKAGVRPVDLGLPLTRWRRTELDRLVGSLPAAVHLASVSRKADDALVERIVDGVAAQLRDRNPGVTPAHSLSMKDAAKFIGVSRSTLYKLIGEGRLETNQIGARVLIKRTDLESLLQARSS
jgi:excisionase family DNA binding protein